MKILLEYKFYFDILFYGGFIACKKGNSTLKEFGQSFNLENEGNQKDYKHFLLNKNAIIILLSFNILPRK